MVNFITGFLYGAMAVIVVGVIAINRSIWWEEIKLGQCRWWGK
jgi:hypothetical protein